MTKVTINPGVCGLITSIEASSEDQMEVTVKVDSGCASIQKMFDDLGETFDAYEVCLGKPGTGALYEYASEHLPGHASCPAIAGMIKCMEVECKLALPKEAWIRFE
ncbi:DUF6951 family protein [uncultured Robinsoniella sp.]|uniref:DUF6951 family protein n=1 Tax=uncultured Robinsoniella sp. TaxID=904190 RepID=UPI00374F602E